MDMDKTSPSRIFAIRYIDEGGTSEQFSNRPSKVYKEIVIEEKRRLKIQIRYKMLSSESFKNKINHKMKLTHDYSLETDEIYTVLNKLSIKQLTALIHSVT
jgi:hypothetical protein